MSKIAKTVIGEKYHLCKPFTQAGKRPNRAIQGLTGLGLLPYAYPVHISK